MGGIEAGETAEEAARREITEETGYTDMTFISEMPVRLNSKFYAAHKDVNRNIITTVLRFKLNSLTAIDTQHEAHEDFESAWVPRNNLSKLGPVSELSHILRWLDGETHLFASEGMLINSGAFDGMVTSEAREEIVAWLEQQGVGRSKISYKMRDWLISRQRYWGAPIPIVHCPEHGAVAVPEDQLPVVLPVVEDFAPKGDGKSPLARQDEWVKTTCPTCGGPAMRETDVMDGYACSSWYLLRYTDPHNTEAAWDPAIVNHWAPLDMYVGGDHAVAHLLYVRFWTHVFKDMGLTDFKEPVGQLVYHGLIQAEDGRKMSKSLGNTVDPLEVIDQGYGADALRTFELFLGPINEDSNWSSRGIAGVYRFLNRVWTLTQEYIESGAGSSKPATEMAAPLATVTHSTIKKVTDDIYRLSFNTAIAAMMECVNELYKLKLDGFSSEWQFTFESLVKLLQPFTVAIVVQVNGKVRAKLEVAAGTSEEDVKKAALADGNVQKFIDGEPKKVIYIPNKLISVVA